MNRIYMIAVACFATLTAWAQNIAVVSPGNVTTIYQTLDDAITGAISGSTIYLPGGGFQIKDDTKINKKLTIMGVSHRGDTDNADGATMIAGNLNFIGQASGSAVIGVYISGNINVGNETDAVNNLTVRYCNVNSIQVNNSESSGMIVNQCYIRGSSSFGNTNAKITNCVTNLIKNVNGGTIAYNVVLGVMEHYNRTHFSMWDIYNSNIIGNIFRARLIDNYSSYYYYGVNNCTGDSNYNANFGDNPIQIEVGMDVFFKKWNNGTISPGSNFHFKDEYKEYENKVGIYAGSTPFRDDNSLAPIPRIVSKKVAEQADGTGKLKIEVTVKAN